MESELRHGVAHRDLTRGITRVGTSAPTIRDNTGDGDGVTLFGHAAVTDQWTELHDVFGAYQERIAPGAFKKTLAERGAPKVLFNHGREDPRPIGIATKSVEDPTGLYLEASLFSDTAYVSELLPALRSGAIDGMSFMFDVVEEAWTWADSSDSGMDERTIQQVRLYEAGPVVWPAYEQTDVGIRSTVDPDIVRTLDDDGRRLVAELCRTSTVAAARLAAPIQGHETSTAAVRAAANQHRSRSLSHKSNPRRGLT